MLKKHHGFIYFFGLLLLAAALPLSVFLLSVAQIILLINWMLEGDFKGKWLLAKERKSVWAFAGIYMVHIIGMFYSSDWNYGMHDLKIKLPLLVLPVILGTSKPVSRQKLIYILQVFCAAVFVSTMVSTGKLFGWWGSQVSDVRDISIFISHIRFSLMINMAVFILAWLIFNDGNSWIKSIYFPGLIWLVFFLFLLKSLTGIVVLLIVTIFLVLRNVIRTKNIMLKWFLLIALILIFLLSSAFFSNSIARFNYKQKINPEELDKVTLNGNPYSHNLLSTDYENGYYTWIYVCDTELEKEWNKRSKLNFRGNDLKGQELRYTIIRYLTSMSLRKDSLGISSLSSQDIQNIEHGMANYIYAWKYSLYPRIYQILWEVHQYKNGGNPSGHSFTQRLEYLKTSLHIINSNFWTGVGTGDVAQAFKKQYKEDQSQLSEQWQLRAHNQFLTFFITFGLIGFIIISVALIYPILNKIRNNYFLILFSIIGFLSFLNEDTLETHAGISFFAFFYALFLYQLNNE